MPTEKRAEPLRAVATSFSFSYDLAFKAAKDGRIRTIRFGNRIYVPADEIERLSREGLARHANEK